MSGTTSPAFSPDYLHATVGGDQAMFDRLLGIFVETTGEMLADMDEAMACGDLSRVAALAHSLRGCVDIVGEDDLSARLKAVEEAALRNDEGAVRKQAIACASLLRHFAADIEIYRNTRAACRDKERQNGQGRS